MAARKRERRITVVTGTRAECGLLQPIMHAIDDRPELDMQIVVSGMHLVTGTWRDVTDAGFMIAAKVPMQRKDMHGRTADADALGRGVCGFNKAFSKLKPDLVLVLGDRIEALAAALAASVGGIRLAHIHGGDRAEGVADEAMRHAISKLAQLHFAATSRSRQRLIRMGENPQYVFNTGSPAADDLRDTKPDSEAPGIIVLQHPIGSSDAQEQRWMHQTLQATRDYPRIVMSPNHDPGCEGIRRAICDAGITPADHLPRAKWLSMLCGACVLVGNSSAGLIEAAILKTPAVNIGPRQAGREKPRNVVDCEYGTQIVQKAINQALKLDLSRMRHPYGCGQTGTTITALLAELDLHRIPLNKHNSY